MYLSLAWWTLRQHKQRYNDRCRTREGARSVACKGLDRSCNVLGYISQGNTSQHKVYHNHRQAHHLVVVGKVLLFSKKNHQLVLQPAQASLQTSSLLKHSS